MTIPWNPPFEAPKDKFWYFCEDYVLIDRVAMNAMKDEKDGEFRETKTPFLRVATGGKGPPDEPSTNWLAELEPRTAFVARQRNSNDIDYNQYYVLFKSLPEVVLLKWILPDGKLLDYYVDPVRFSKKFPDYVVLGVDKQEEPEQQAEVRDDEQSAGKIPEV